MVLFIGCIMSLSGYTATLVPVSAPYTYLDRPEMKAITTLLKSFGEFSPKDNPVTKSVT